MKSNPRLDRLRESMNIEAVDLVALGPGAHLRAAHA